MIYSHIEIELRFDVSCLNHKYFQGSDEEHVQNWSSFGVVVFQAMKNENTLSSRYVMGLNWYLTRAILVLNSFQSVHPTLKLKRSRRLFIQFVAFLNGNWTWGVSIICVKTTIYHGSSILHRNLKYWHLYRFEWNAIPKYFQRFRIMLSSFIS